MATFKDQERNERTYIKDWTIVKITKRTLKSNW